MGRRSIQPRLVVVCMLAYAIALNASVVSEQAKESPAWRRAPNDYIANIKTNISVPDEEISPLAASFSDTELFESERSSATPTKASPSKILSSSHSEKPSDIKKDDTSLHSPTPTRTETPKPQTPKPQTPKPQTPKPETLKPETLKPETLKPETLTASRTSPKTKSPKFSHSRKSRKSKSRSPLTTTEKPQTRSVKKSPKPTDLHTQSLRKSASVLHSRSMSAISDYVDADQSSSPSIIFPVVMIGACFGGCYYFGKKYNIIGSDGGSSSSAANSSRTARPARHARTRRGADYELEPLNQDDDYEDSFA